MLIEVWSGLDHQLTLHMDPNTKLHQFKAYNSVLSVEKALALQAWVELLKYKAQLCIQGNQMYEGLRKEKEQRKPPAIPLLLVGGHSKSYFLQFSMTCA